MLVKINVCILFSNVPRSLTLFLLLKNNFFSQSKTSFSYWYSFKTLMTIDNTAIYLWEIDLIVKQRRLICSNICLAHKVIKIILQETREMEYTNMYL